eukprot:TRINITY_DN32983_c0_g1_i1.p1 TRINITY_DN32983_c0_g1~~TRINITY_DN32983_c0_g1_i1.p1  ORF type:complete len:623 (+),score=198.72 TRINITY_DN32983_c0_g1_i1:80-1948(+)
MLPRGGAAAASELRGAAAAAHACRRCVRPQLRPCSTQAGGGGDAPYSVPAEVRERLERQLRVLYPSRRPAAEAARTRMSRRRREGRGADSSEGRVTDSELEDKYPLKTLDLKALEEEVGGAPHGLMRVARHRQLLRSLGRLRRSRKAAAQLHKASRWAAPKRKGGLPKERGRSSMRYWEAKQLHTPGEALLDAELKRTVPVAHMADEDRVRLAGRAPSPLEARDELDPESLAFFLRSSLDRPRTPWDRGDNPYDLGRLRELLDRKTALDRIQHRLAEIEVAADLKMAPEYNYLRLRGRHLFHRYLDDLAALRKDLLEGLVEEADQEWDMFERHERKRIEGLVAKYADAEGRAAGTAEQPDRGGDGAAQPAEPAGAPAEGAGPPPEPRRRARAKGRLQVARERERRFKERVERREVRRYLAKLRREEQARQAEELSGEAARAEDEPPLIWGTAPPTLDHLEYQARTGRAGTRGWQWQREVRYVPAIPWREAQARKEGQWPFYADDLELPMDWEENYRHFPYYRRQQLWQDRVHAGAVPSTEPDWPHRDEEFLDVYVSKTEFTHPADWAVRLGNRRRSKYKTLRGSIFDQWYHMSPYENEEFRSFMADPTSVPQHRLGMDLLGF